MEILARYWREGLLSLLLVYMFADWVGVFESLPAQGFGVTVGQTVDLNEYAPAPNYSRLFEGSDLAIVNFAPIAPTYLNNWDEFILYVRRETGSVFLIVANKRHSSSEDCLADFSSVAEELAKNGAKGRSIAGGETGEVIGKLEFRELGARLSCVRHDISEPWAKPGQQYWVNLSLTYS